MRGTCGERRLPTWQGNQGQGDTPPERPGPVRQGDSQISGNREAEVPSAPAAAGIAYPDVAAKPDDEEYSMPFPGRGERESVYEQPDWAGIHRELARVGVTLRILHGEYADE